ncbi:N-acetylmuramoyl-L-alanine amidase [Polyangium sorediatum]|uniref:N-acetylmuramoyl-L-alanine amidase n=1 Tax=Polyangium sorediatum TaxID=889274 RepID=A0ABT6NPA3_9BACT|nr:N-acetylmuramoyl-L-alanine amidase [Polyangium sorediatum]MDI1430149.1 N-acetylmuramoyl-L-alanine amidase [Polyangium sorediatum]
MIYLLAGHHNFDPGASGKRHVLVGLPQYPYIRVDTELVNESTLTKELRNLTVQKLALSQFQARKATVAIDDDNDSLRRVIKKIKSTQDDVVCELHFNSGNRTDSGVLAIHPEKATEKELELAQNIADTLSSIMGLRKVPGAKPGQPAGMWSERETRHKTLGIMRPKGTNVLVEVCYLSNPFDIARYDLHKEDVALALADLLTRADGVDGMSP